MAKSSLRSWMELVRFPNLLTVPGDPLSGWILAGGALAGDGSRLARVGGISLCLYIAGLLLNDIVDLKTDRRERPARPLPSGRVSVAGACLAALLCLAGAAWLAWPMGRAVQVLAGVLVAMIAGYNLLYKSRAVLGPASMGACRALSLLLGAWAVDGVPDWIVWIAAAGLWLYVVGISVNAADETGPRVPGMRRWLPAVSVGMCLGVLGGLSWVVLLETSPGGAVLFLAISVWAFLRCWVVGDLLGVLTPLPVPVLIGALIGTLPILQAAFVLVAGREGLPAALALLAAAWLFPRLTRSFYSS